MTMAGCEVLSISPSHTRTVQESGTLGTGDMLGTLGGDQEKDTHVTLSCWTGLHWAEWLEGGKPRPDCIPTSAQGPVPSPGKGWILVL